MNLAVRDIRHSLGRFGLTTIGVGMLLMVVMGMGAGRANAGRPRNGRPLAGMLGRSPQAQGAISAPKPRQFAVRTACA